jgi:CubicO group peptidase (beta-lactamase class C family)
MTISLCALCGFFCSCTKRTLPGADWQRMSPKQAGFDGGKLRRELDVLRKASGGPGVVVIRHGFLVFAVGKISQPCSLFSLSKSLTSLVFGYLQQQGRVKLDDPVVLPDDPMARRATFRQYLNMTSNYGLDPPVAGKYYAYNNAAFSCIGEYLRDHYFLGQSSQEILQAALWDYIGRQDPVDFASSWSGWDGGFRISARDLARIGLLVLNQGRWNDRQVIAPEFIAALYRPQIPQDAEMNSSSDPAEFFNQLSISKRMKGHYSFGWWVSDVENGNGRFISGRGRQRSFLIIVPRLDLVIAVTNHNRGNRHYATDIEYLKVIEDNLVWWQ